MQKCKVMFLKLITVLMQLSLMLRIVFWYVKLEFVMLTFAN